MEQTPGPLSKSTLSQSTDANEPTVGVQLSGLVVPRAEVLIVSCHGRGDWLALELVNRGWQVTLMDVSSSLEPVEIEDAFGPFGLFQSDDLLDSQKSNPEFQKSPAGFTLWLNSGPIEFTGSLSEFQLGRLPLTTDVTDYLRSLPFQKAKERVINRLAVKLDRAEFKTSWLAHLAHQIAAPVVFENHQSFLDKSFQTRALDLLQPYFVAVNAPQSLQNSLRHCAKQGVRVLSGARIESVEITKKSNRGSGAFGAIQVDTGRKQTETARCLVWALSADETERFPEAVSRQFFPHGKATATWYWTRYRIDLGAGTAAMDLDQLPLQILLVGDVFLPWTHANAILLKRRASELAFDAWVRLPVRAAGDLNYRKELGAEIENVLKERWPRFSAKTAPHAAARDSVDRLRVALFDPDEFMDVRPFEAPSVFSAGPETWDSININGRLQRHLEVLEGLEKLKGQWTQQEAKLAAKAAARGKS